MLKVCMKLEKENIILPPSTGGSVVQNPPAKEEEAGKKKDFNLCIASIVGDYPWTASCSSCLGWICTMVWNECISIFCSYDRENLFLCSI